MDNRKNRWLAGLSLFALFGVIALAGSRAQGTQNVVVTNTSMQQVPVLPAARPAPGGAYIVSVANAPNVKVVASPTAPLSTKDVNGIDPTSQVHYLQGTISAGAVTSSSSFVLSASEPSIVDSVDAWTHSAVFGEAGDFVEVFVLSGGSPTSDCAFPLMASGHGNFTIDSASSRIPVPAGATVIVTTYREGGSTGSCDFSVNLMYHSVRSP